MHPALAVVQSAALAGITVGVAAADAAPFGGLVTKEDLEVALRIARLGPGRADARAAVTLADGLAESPGECWARVVFVSTWRDLHDAAQVNQLIRAAFSRALTLR